MKKLFLVCALVTFGLSQAFAQLDEDEFEFFNHVSAGVSLGTDGIGIEVAAPLTYNFAVRAGYVFMPKFKYKEKDVNIGKDAAFINGETQDQLIDIEGKLNMGDFKLLFDYYPFRTSSFHVTAGAYIGKGKVVEAYNATPFLKQSAWGNKGIELGSGTNSYTLVSESDGNFKAEAKVNSFKPYLGIGFGRAVPKGRVGVQFDLGVQFWGKPEVWGNINSVNQSTGMLETRYQKIDKDRIVTEGKDKGYQDVKDAVKNIEKFSVYPVLTLRINGRIF